MPVQKSWDHMFQSTDELTWWKLSLRMSDLFVFQGLGTIFAIVPI